MLGCVTSICVICYSDSKEERHCFISIDLRSQIYNVISGGVQRFSFSFSKEVFSNFTQAVIFV